MQFEQIRALISADMRAVDDTIQQCLQSDVALINQLSHYIINSGGKRLRPQLVLLAARAAGYPGNAHIRLAAIIEFIHTATLLHDDVVDDSKMRRGQESANAVWGNEAAVLVGDFLYSRAFEMMVGVGSMRVMDILSHTTNAIAEGEVLQLLNIHDPETTEEAYLNVIRRKTAKLFEAASQLGGVLAEVPQTQEKALAQYGMHLGTAFQLIDDVLDYSESSDAIGKNIGDDLAEGKPTLPLIYAMHNGDEAQSQVIRHAIKKGGLDDIEAVLAAIKETGAIDYSQVMACKEADAAKKALYELPDNDYRDALNALAKFSVSRHF